MVFKKINFWIFLALICLIFVIFEFINTGKANLKMDFSFQETFPEGVKFTGYLQSGGFSQDLSISSSKTAEAELKGIPFGEYSLALFLDEKRILSENFTVEKKPSFWRQNENELIKVGEIASITSIEFSLNDPFIMMKWQSEFLGEYTPKQFEITIEGETNILNVNFTEIDIRKFLNQGKESIQCILKTISKDSFSINRLSFQIPVNMEKLIFDLPPQLDSFEVSARVNNNKIQIDPYSLSIEFPVLAYEESLPVDVLYFGQKIYETEINPKSKINQIKLPLLPIAIVSNAKIENEKLSFVLSLEGQEKFFFDFFEDYVLSYNGTETTTERFFETASTDAAQNIYITPSFAYNVVGRVTLFEKPSKPEFNVKTKSNPANNETEISIFTETDNLLKGQYRVDRKEWIKIPEFTAEASFTSIMERNEAHLVEIGIFDGFNQKADYSHWIDPLVPETTFFKKIQISEKRLFLEWEKTESYDSLELIVADDYNKMVFYPEENTFEADLSKAPFSERFKIILKGKKNGSLYVASIVEGLSLE